MTELSGLQIFKYLPAAKKAEHTNCKECGCPTCMAFALKLAKGNVEIGSCSHAPKGLLEAFEHSRKQPQKIIDIKGVKVGGENVLYRHEKTFLHPTVLAVLVDLKAPDAEQTLERIKNFEITRVSEKFKVDLVIIRNANFGEELLKRVQNDINFITEDEFNKLQMKEINLPSFSETVDTLVETRKKAVLEKDENYSDPVYVHFTHEENHFDLCARASYYICKYANMLIFDDFEETLFATLITLRHNIFTDPQKPLQVEAKVYGFNEPDENSIVFMTTNFALTFFAVANELENLSVPSYLVVTPADGMSVLTAWSAEKFTAQMVARTLKKFDLAGKVKNRKIIIPGLLSHMKEELEEAIEDFEIVVGTVEAYAISDFVKNMNMNINK